MIFLLCLKFYQNFGKVKQILFGEYMFCITLKGSFLGPKFLICLKVHTLEDSFTFIWKEILGYIFTFKSSGLNCKFICREYGLSINLKISFLSSSDQPILTLKISVKNFSRFRYFANFDIKILLLS